MASYRKSGTKFALSFDKEITIPGTDGVAGENVLGIAVELSIPLHMVLTPMSHTIRKSAFRQSILAAFLLVSGYVSAIDGVLSIGDKNRRAHSFSNIKRDLKLSLGTGTYHYQSSHTLPTLTHPQAMSGPRSMVIYQRGNVSIHIPVKSRPAILQTFRTPAAPSMR
jgi:hypothetical protein